MKRIYKKRVGQTTLEYATLIMIVCGALFAMQTYFKRGIQGRWRSAIDELSDQYDPFSTEMNVVYSLASNVEVKIRTHPLGVDKLWTERTDITNSVDSKSGYTNIFGYGH